MLLWHGSRITNMAGILGQGLRIAPPEAPVTGYMVCITVRLLYVIVNEFLLHHKLNVSQ